MKKFNVLIRSAKIWIATILTEILLSFVISFWFLWMYQINANFLFFLIFCLGVINAIFTFKRLPESLKAFKNLKICKAYVSKMEPIIVEIEIFKAGGFEEKAKIKEKELDGMVIKMNNEMNDDCP